MGDDLRKQFSAMIAFQRGKFLAIKRPIGLLITVARFILIYLRALLFLLLHVGRLFFGFRRLSGDLYGEYAGLFPPLEITNKEYLNLTRKSLALVCTYTNANSEPRVIRQVAHLLDLGFHVIVYAKEYQQPPNRIFESSNVTVITVETENNLYNSRLLSAFYRMLATRVGSHFHWYMGFQGYREYYMGAKSVNRLLSKINKSVAIAVYNDWFTFPISRLNISKKYYVDVHEFATEQFAHDKAWVINEKPHVEAWMREIAVKAPLVTFVSPLIAEASVAFDESFKNKNIVVRSAAFLNKQFKKPFDQGFRELVYVGDISETRGLDLIIQALSLQKIKRIRLNVVGPRSDYSKTLVAMSEKLGIPDLLVFHKLPEFTKVNEFLTQFHIGIFVHKNISKQKEFTLPNKVFSYIQARLPMVLSELPELVRVAKGGAIFFRDYDAKSLCRLLEGQTDKQIANVKAHVVELQKSIHWESEAAHLTKKLRDLDLI